MSFSDYCIMNILIIFIAQEGGRKTKHKWRLLVTILTPTATVIFLVGAFLYYFRKKKLRSRGILLVI